MAKPIGIVYLPDSWTHENGLFKQDKVSNWRRDLDHHFPDYYWLALPDPNTEKVYLNVFHEKDITEIQYGELIKLVTDKLNDKHSPR